MDVRSSRAAAKHNVMAGMLHAGPLEGVDVGQACRAGLPGMRLVHVRRLQKSDRKMVDSGFVRHGVPVHEAVDFEIFVRY